MELRLHDVPACDFCGSLEPYWLYRCRNYRMVDMYPAEGLLPPQESTGGWLACHACAPYVTTQNWHGLVRRVTACGGINPQIQAALQMLDKDTVEKFLQQTWRQFAANRVGSAIEWRPQHAD